MSNANPRYLKAWPKEEEVTAGGVGTVTSVGAGSGLLGGPITAAGTLSVDYGTSADLIAGTDNVKLFHAAALAGASVLGLSAGAADAKKLVRLDASGYLAPSILGPNAIAATTGAADAGKLVKTDATGKIDPSFLPAAGGTGTVTSVATGAGLTGGPVTTTGTISLAASGVTAGTAGSATQVPVLTVDTYGRITGFTNTTITPAWTSVTGTPTTVAGYGITDAALKAVTITGATSLTGGGDLSANRTISLSGDVAAPGNSFYYGTDGTGTKGWYALPAGGGGGSGTVTSITAGTGLTGGTISTSGTIALATSGVTAGTYQSVTVDAYGRVTAGTNPTTLAGYGITDAVAATRAVNTSGSLTGGGNLSADRTIGLVGDVAAPGNSFYYGTNSTGVKGFYALPSGGTGDVVGPASATDNGVARFDLATGKLIQGSGVIIDDLNNMSGVVNLTTSGNTILGDAAADTYTFNGSTMAVPNGLNIDANTLMIDAANNRVGFGTATPLSTVDINGLMSENVIALSGAAQAINVAAGRNFTSIISAATTFTITGSPATRSVRVLVAITNGGSQTVTWPAAITWVNGSQPSMRASGVDIIAIWTFNGGTNWYGQNLTPSDSSGGTVTSAEATTTGFSPGDGFSLTLSVLKGSSSTLGNLGFQTSTNGGTTWSATTNLSGGFPTNATEYIITIDVVKLTAGGYAWKYHAVSNSSQVADASNVGSGWAATVNKVRLAVGAGTSITSVVAISYA